MIESSRGMLESCAWMLSRKPSDGRRKPTQSEAEAFLALEKRRSEDKEWHYPDLGGGITVTHHDTSMSYDERLAQRIVEAAIPELALSFNVNQSSSVADFSIMKCGEEIGVLEVTRFTIQEAEEIRSLIQENPFIERTHCESDWYIHLGENARINDVRKCADRYLRDVELSGTDCFFSPIHARIEPVRRIWEDLCVEGGAKTKWKRPGIGLLAPSSGGLASSDGIWKEVQPEVSKKDNRRKLGQSVGSNRHLFVVIDGLQGSAYVSIRRCEPPQDVPDLPSEITHLWLAAEEGALVYVWLADSDGWQNFTVVVNGNT